MIEGKGLKEYPLLLEEWDYKKNGDTNPCELLATSNEKYWWKCDKGHSYESHVSTRTRGGECRYCVLNQTSKLEIRAYCEVSHFFQDSAWRNKIHGKEADISSQKYLFVIEVDGFPWHKNILEKDKQKTNWFNRHGYETIRIRDKKNPKIKGDVFSYDQNTKSSIKFAIHSAICHLLEKKGETFPFDENWVNQGKYDQMLEDYPGPQKDKSLGGRNPQLVDLWSPNNVISIFKATISHEKYLFVCPKCNAEYSRDAKNADGRNGDCLSCARILSAKKMRKNQKLKFPKKEESLGGLNTNRLQFPIGGGSL